MTPIPEMSEPVKVVQSEGLACASGFSGASSIPPTPNGMYDYGQTPTGTPGGAILFTRSIDMEAARTTLSLVDMIQSPKGGEAKSVMMQASYPTVYKAAPQVTQVTQVMQPQYQTVVSSVQPAVMSQPSNPPPPPPQYSAPVPQPQVTVAPAPHSSLPSAAAVQLGLVSHSSAPAVATASSRLGTMGGSCAAPAPTVMSLPPATFSGGAAAVHGTQYVTAASAIAQAPPVTTYQTQAHQTTVVTGQPQRMVPPPPPLAPAPMSVMSPTARSIAPVPLAVAGAAPVAQESDIRMLLDMAMASGNQKAVDAALRQAQQAGIHLEPSTALMSR